MLNLNSSTNNTDTPETPEVADPVGNVDSQSAEGNSSTITPQPEGSVSVPPQVDTSNTSAQSANIQSAASTTAQQSNQNVDTTPANIPTQQNNTPLNNTSFGAQNFNASSNETKPKKRRFFLANTYILVSLVIITIVGGLGYYFLTTSDNATIEKLLGSEILTKLNPATNEEDPAEETPNQPLEPSEPEEPPVDPESIVEFNSHDLEFALYYKAKASLTEPGSFTTPLETYQIKYEGPQQQETLTGAENLLDGYIFNLTIHKNILNNDLQEITLDKRNRYLISCGQNAQISSIEERTIANRTATTFTIENCGATYVISFFLRGDDLYEFNEIYRGNVGVRQVYAAELDDIITQFGFINTVQPTPQNTWSTFTNSEIEFIYPSELDVECCTLQGPISNSARKIIVLAHPDSLSGNNSAQFNGFGIYFDTVSSTYEEYLESQRSLLQENYRVTIGRNPVVTEEEVLVDDIRGTLLKGYAWWGDMYFFEMPYDAEAEAKKSERDRSLPQVMVIVKTEVDEGSFTGVFNEIMTNFTFRNKDF